MFGSPLALQWERGQGERVSKKGKLSLIVRLCHRPGRLLSCFVTGARGPKPGDIG